MQSKDVTVTVVLSIWRWQAERGSATRIRAAMTFSLPSGLFWYSVSCWAWLVPRRPWLWPPLVAIWVPVLDAVLPQFGLAPQRPGESFTFLSALAVTGVVDGCLFRGLLPGAGLVWAVRHAWQGASEAQR